LTVGSSRSTPCPLHHSAGSLHRTRRRDAGARAPVRALTRRGGSPRQAEYHRPVTEGYCVVATRGRELPEVNCQSVTKRHREMSNVNSIRPDDGTSLRALCEVRPEAHASQIGRSCTVDGAGQQDNERVLKETVNERKAAPSPSGGWRQNGRKRKRDKQGDPSVPVGALGQQSAQLAGGSQSVRSSEEAGNDRGAKGRRKMEVPRTERRNNKPTRVPARANRWGNQPSTIDWVDTECLTAGLGDEASTPLPLIRDPLTGKPDAGNPPVRFGGRGGAKAPSLPLSRRSLFGTVRGATVPTWAGMLK
jgi:hypothetical protein